MAQQAVDAMEEVEKVTRKLKRDWTYLQTRHIIHPSHQGLLERMEKPCLIFNLESLKGTTEFLP
jgi:hypothetical protein